jgi:hypothetical protein
MKPVAVLIAGVLTPAVLHRLVSIPPLGQMSVEVILVRIDDRAQDQRFHGRLLDVFEHPHDDLSAELEPPENRRLLFFQGTAPASALQAPSSALTAFFLLPRGGPYGPPRHQPRHTRPRPTASAPFAPLRCPCAMARPCGARPLCSDPTPAQSARWKGSGPSGTGTRSTPAAAGGSREDRSGQVVKVAAANRAVIFPARRLGRVMTLPGHFVRRTMRAAHSLRPAPFAYFVVTLGIVQKVLKVKYRANILKA